MNLKLMGQYIITCKKLNKQPTFEGLWFFKKAFS